MRWCRHASPRAVSKHGLGKYDEAVRTPAAFRTDTLGRRNQQRRKSCSHTTDRAEPLFCQNMRVTRRHRTRGAVSVTAPVFPGDAIRQPAGAFPIQTGAKPGEPEPERATTPSNHEAGEAPPTHGNNRSSGRKVGTNALIFSP